MKKLSALLVAVLCAVSLTGCEDKIENSISQVQQAVDTERESPVVLTQESVIVNETFASPAKYRAFLDSSERDWLIPGLKQHMVPQGLAQSAESGLTYISAYSSDKEASAVMVLDRDGTFVAEYLFYKDETTPLTYHLGGVAVTDTTLFVSYDGDGAYRVVAIPHEELTLSGSQTVIVDTVYETPVATSFLSYYDGILWMGNFYLPDADYGLMRELNTPVDTADGQYGCFIAGFDLREGGNARLIQARGSRYATPDYVLAAPTKVQGMVFDPATSTVILSRSWGRKNDASLSLYTVDLTAEAETMVSLNGVELPCHLLDTPDRVVTTMPMTEGITLDGNGGVRVLFESGAEKYADGYHRTDRIWSYTYR